jgi:hypothetical protein
MASKRKPHYGDNLLKNTPENYTPERVAEIAGWVKECSSIKEAYDVLEKRLKVTRDHVGRINRKYGFWASPCYSSSTAPKGANERKSFVSKDDNNVAYSLSVNGDLSLEEVVEQCGIDSDLWSVKSFGVNGPNKLGLFTWRVAFERKKVDLKKEFKTMLNEWRDEAKAEKWLDERPVTDHKPEAAGYLLEISIVDPHFGKLSWQEESGASYDLKIAKKAYLDTVEDLLAKASKYGKINRILACCGNDYLNADSALGETTKGTKQDMDSRFGKVYREARETLIESIEMMRKIAPVDIIIKPGNHDETSMFHLGDAIECWYHNAKDVQVDNSAESRKYYRYGATMIAYTHGDKESHKKLPLLGAIERKKDWAECKYHEWHVAHLHQERVTEDMGIKVRILPSITAPDHYHASHGYVGNIRNAQAFLFSKSDGLEAIIYSKPIGG